MGVFGRILARRLCFLFWATCPLLVHSASTISTFVDGSCKTSHTRIDGPNGYPDGLCSKLDNGGSTGAWSSFQVVQLDPGCVVTLYGPDSTSLACSSISLQIGVIGTCYSATTWRYYSIDNCLVVAGGASSASSVAIAPSPTSSVADLGSLISSASASSILSIATVIVSDGSSAASSAFIALSPSSTRIVNSVSSGTVSSTMTPSTSSTSSSQASTVSSLTSAVSYTTSASDSSSTAAPPPAASSASGVNIGAIVGGVVGGISALILLVLVWRYLAKRKSRKQHAHPQPPEQVGQVYHEAGEVDKTRLASKIHEAPSSSGPGELPGSQMAQQYHSAFHSRDPYAAELHGS